MEKRKVDIKEMYKEKAEELARDERGREFEELSENEKDEVYRIAIRLVGEELQEAADSLRKEVRVNE